MAAIFVIALLGLIYSTGSIDLSGANEEEMSIFPIAILIFGAIPGFGAVVLSICACNKETLAVNNIVVIIFFIKILLVSYCLIYCSSFGK